MVDEDDTVLVECQERVGWRSNSKLKVKSASGVAVFPNDAPDFTLCMESPAVRGLHD